MEIEVEHIHRVAATTSVLRFYHFQLNLPRILAYSEFSSSGPSDFEIIFGGGGGGSGSEQEEYVEEEEGQEFELEPEEFEPELLSKLAEEEQLRVFDPGGCKVVCVCEWGRLSDVIAAMHALHACKAMVFS